MDPYVQLAKDAISFFLKSKKLLPLPNSLPPEMRSQRAGVFVSLHQTCDHMLRGCIGTFQPTQTTLAEEIIANACAAAFDDPRFLPLKAPEVKNITIHVDVLSKPEPIPNLQSLNPKTFGLIVRNSSGRSGLLLPDIGVETVREQFSICCEKGGIMPDDRTIQLYRFTVTRHV
ncbi:MAG: AmmeMemoRadiSam system protein A [Patescibacteria group bacterium]|nr:AmmeMemoRadiSam system protein A [Patescibacteria group bacterium]